MKYEFRHKETNDRVVVDAPMDWVGQIAEALLPLGFRRVFEPVQFNMELSMEECYEESVAVAEEEDRRRAKAGQEAMRDLADIASHG